MRPFYCVFPILSALILLGCAAGPLYPPRPPATPGLPPADPAPSKVVVHVTVTSDGLRSALDDVLPLKGSGTFELRGKRNYAWARSPLKVTFGESKVHVRATVVGTAELPLLGTQKFPLELLASAEPIISSDYRARLQSARVTITTADDRILGADKLGAGIIETIRSQVQQQIDGFAYDLRPLLLEAYRRVARPIDLPVGDAHGCAELHVTGFEAGPTVLADGFEKDFALVVAPSVTLPCAASPIAPTPPPMANVATLTTGPFVVTVPIAARYDELAKTMTLAFTNGKLFFSKEFPTLYLADPEVYSGADQLVLKVRIGGEIAKSGLHVNLDGNIYFAGHPAVVDNELRIPDLQPTIETSSFLLKLKAAIDADSIRTQAQAALKLDLGQRLASVRAKLSSDLGFGAGLGCLRSEVSKIEVTGVFPHATYLRLYVTLTAQAGVYLPCPGDPATPSAPAAPAAAATAH